MIGDEVEEIDLTENRLGAIDERILGLKRLKKISFRKNLLKDVTCLEEFQAQEGIVEVVLYDNLIKRLPNLSKCKSLQKLDVSYNQLRSMLPVSHIHSDNIRVLYLACNKVRPTHCAHPWQQLR